MNDVYVSMCERVWRETLYVKHYVVVDWKTKECDGTFWRLDLSKDEDVSYGDWWGSGLMITCRRLGFKSMVLVEWNSQQEYRENLSVYVCVWVWK